MKRLALGMAACLALSGPVLAQEQLIAAEQAPTAGQPPAAAQAPADPQAPGTPAAPQAPGAPAPGGPGRGISEIMVIDLGHGLYQLNGGANSVLAVGTDAAIVVDAKTTPQAARLVKKVAETTNLPVKYVINTHYHNDHVGANEAFAQQGAIIVATVNAAKRMSDSMMNPRGVLMPPVPEGGRPTVTFTDKKTISIPGQPALITAVGPAHTDGDAFVYFPEANVLAMGDIHHSNEYPVYDAGSFCKCGSYDGMLAAYDAALKVANDNTKIVPGHGPLTNKAEVVVYRKMLQNVRDQVIQMVNAGKTEDEVVAAKLLADDKSLLPGGPDNRDGFIRTLYNAEKTGVGK